jgi:hypothetical protein
VHIVCNLQFYRGTALCGATFLALLRVPTRGGLLMAGQRRILAAGLVLSLLIVASSTAMAQPREAEEPIGGITFKPPRPALVRLKSRNLLRGDLLAISPEWVQFRLQSGKVFDYPIRDVVSVVVNDTEFRYTLAHDTYQEAVEDARKLIGVTIETTSAAAGVASNVPKRMAPPPPLPVMLDSPDNYKPLRVDSSANLASVPRALVGQNQVAGAVAGQPAGMPPIPAQQPTNNAGLANVPIHETGAFKIGFLVACFVIILLWWRNRVG